MDPQTETGSSDAKGFTMIELLVSFVLFAIVMGSAISLLMSQRALYDVQGDRMELQRNVRAAVGLVAGELRSVPDGGVVEGKPDSVVVRYPIRWGLVCGNLNTTDAEVYMPDMTDVLFTDETQTGLAFRGADSVWVFVEEPSTSQPWEDSLYVESTVFCTSGPGAKLRETKFDKEGNITEAGDTAQAFYRRFFDYLTYVGEEAYQGAQMIAYTEVTYRFGPSVFEPGTRALFRVTSAGEQELSGLFDSDSGFEYVLENGNVHTTLPNGQADNVAEIRINAFATKDNQSGGRARTLDYDATVTVPLRNAGEQQ
jgi:prepilin-type N-terminal cleavage/methylation domain-containing protein